MGHESRFFQILHVSGYFINNVKCPNQRKWTIHGRPESGPDLWPPAVVLAGAGRHKKPFPDLTGNPIRSLGIPFYHFSNF